MSNIFAILKLSSMTEVKNFKCLLVGDCFCGKTTYIRKLSNNDINKTLLLAKNVFPVTFSTNLGTICFNVYETDSLNGQRDSFFQNAQCAIILFDVMSPSSFDNILYWHRKIKSLNGRIPIALCANKVDIKTRKVKPDDITCTWGNRLRCFEVSAKTNLNIDDPFIYLAERLLNKGKVLELSKIGSEVGVSLSTLHQLIEEAKEKNNKIIE